MSYALLTLLAPNNTTNATFQAWGSAVSAAIANCGWQKWADANVGTQINWATVAAPNTNNQSCGYEIWSPTDAQQATAPMVLKLEWGAGSSGAGSLPQMWYTLGASCNTTGGLANTAGRQGLAISGNQLAGINCMFSGSTSRFAVCMWQGSVNFMFFFGVERSVDNNGAYTTDGAYTLWAHSSGAYNRYQVFWTPTTGNVAAWETSWGALTPDSGVNSGLTAGMSGHQLCAYPFWFAYGTFLPPPTMVLAYFQGEFTAGAACPLTFYNTSMTFMPLSNVGLHAASVRGGNKSCLMMRFD